MVPEWASLFSTGEAVCGQCHMLFTANAYLHPEYRGQDFYKYGTEADELRQAMREIYDANPIAAEDAGIGTPYIDEETGAWIYGWGAHPVLEAFQGSKHQSMGVDCVSCHMQKTTAEDGTTYTNHFAAGSPLENPEAVEYCLTCHM